MSVAERPGEEIWELTVPGRVHVEVTNHRGRPQDLTVKGVGSRLRLSTTDREITQERIRSVEHDPFLNGTLRRIDSGAKESDRSADELSDEDLRGVFEMTGPEFEDVVAALSEVNIRRMKELAPKVDATASQTAFLAKIIQQRFPIGGSTPTYDEMMAAPQ